MSRNRTQDTGKHMVSSGKQSLTITGKSLDNMCVAHLKYTG